MVAFPGRVRRVVEEGHEPQGLRAVVADAVDAAALGEHDAARLHRELLALAATDAVELALDRGVLGGLRVVALADVGDPLALADVVQLLRADVPVRALDLPGGMVTSWKKTRWPPARAGAASASR